MGVLMGLGFLRRSSRRVVLRSAGLLSLLILASGCATAQPVATHRLIEHQMQLDFSGLKTAREIPDLRVTSAPPKMWNALPLQKSALFNHQQWKSPSGYTGAGVIYVHLPLPLTTKMLIWLGKLEYSRNSGDGKVLGEWTDTLGRSWFEGESEKYHVRGYVTVEGFSAWVVYFGYKINRPLNTAELGLAARYVESVVPMTGEQQPSKTNLADAGKVLPVGKPLAPAKPG